ncbi:hypothetical protein DY000_02012606 [Brassica cretica]|uniref:Arabidopsis retrotransposon Orf1 C-terminal domain-containing protein n=1 Tax=Brassica cretica TaxID=69181 RepID=A0ABQ7CYC9_BRACR|nr:hypothetical protein DY000_02012606 [Brassica cretica]
MAASSSNKNEETDRSKKVNSMDTRKIDDLAAKMLQQKPRHQQEVSYVNGKGWQFKNYHPNPNVRNNPHMFSYKANPDNPNDRPQGNQFQNPGYQKPYSQNQNRKMFILSQAQNQFLNRQNNPQTAPATASGQPDELKGMMQQLLQGQQIQGKALNQIAQTAETIKRQQGTLPEKTYKNPKDCNAVELRSGRHLPDPVPKKLTAKEKGKQKEEEQPEDVLDHETRRRTASCDRTIQSPAVHDSEQLLREGSLARYNSLLNINILPTRFVDAEALNDLGLHEDLHAVLQVLGISDLCHITYPLYPDLVRQVLATAELTFMRPDFPIFEEASFTFFASGVNHSISLEKLTEIYEISEEYTATSFPRKFPPEQAFWKFTASGDFKSRSASQSHIRNPVLWIAAKVVSNLLFSKDQTSKVQRGELHMLFAGVEDEIRSANIGIPTGQMTTSPGCVLVQMFVDKKARTKGSLKKDRSGSLLTPLFRHLELDLSLYQCNETSAFIDIPYLINCQILHDETTYSFLGKDGNDLYCKLPQPDINSLGDVVNICFVPEPQYLCADPKSSYQDDTMDEPEFVCTVGSDTAYDLGPPGDDADDADYRCWMVDSQRKNNSPMKMILKAITGGCMGAPSTAEPRQDQPTPSNRRPGKEPAGTARGDKETPWATPRKRNRRSAGQSEGDDTD